jgi:hypothetical protein
LKKKSTKIDLIDYFRLYKTKVADKTNQYRNEQSKKRPDQKYHQQGEGSEEDFQQSKRDVSELPEAFDKYGQLLRARNETVEQREPKRG